MFTGLGKMIPIVLGTSRGMCGDISGRSPRMLENVLRMIFK